MKDLSAGKENSLSDTHLEQIATIYPESVILDENLSIQCVSHTILDATGYTLSELKNQPISFFSYAYDFEYLLRTCLKRNTFLDEHFEIRTKSGGAIRYQISGFTLGTFILLKFKNLDEINLIYDRVSERTQELDSFVYLSAHSLRGPLATIKGLLNLTKHTSDRNELDFILHQVDNFAETLDNKLHRLIYFAESDKAYESSTDNLSLEDICQSLEKSIHEISIGIVRFDCRTTDYALSFNHGTTVLSLLHNVMSFCIYQPMDKNHELIMDIHANPTAIEIIVKAKGFLFTDQLLEKMKKVSFGYSEILNYPELINCYAAKKIMFKMKGGIQFIPTHSTEMVVLMTLPQNSAQ